MGEGNQRWYGRLPATSSLIYRLLGRSWDFSEQLGTWVPILHREERGCVSVLISCLSCVQLFATPWTEAHMAPLSIGFSRQEYWSGLPCPSPGDLPYPGRRRYSALRTSFERAQDLKPWNTRTSVYLFSSRFLCSWSLWLLPTLDVILCRSEIYNFDTNNNILLSPFYCASLVGYCDFYTLQIAPPDLAQWMRWGIGKTGFARVTEPPFPFLIPLPLEKLLGWGMRPTALGVLPLSSESRTRFVPLKIRSAGRGPSRQAAPVWCPAKLWAEGGPSRKLVSCRGCRHCRAGLSPEARVTERPGPLGGQPGVGARLCNLKLEKVIKKDILRQGENGSGLKPRKLRAWESDYLGNSNQTSQKANAIVSQRN